MISSYRKLKQDTLSRPALLIGLFAISIATGSETTAAESSPPHYNFRGEEVDLAGWDPQYEERCYFPGKKNLENRAATTIARMLTYLRQVPELSDYLLAAARKMGTIFCLDNRADGTRGYYDYRYNVIAVRESLPFPEKLVIFVHELRHIDNVSRGYCLSLDYDVEEMVRLTYAVEADVQAISALFAWRLREQGILEPWQALSELTNYGDIARVFERTMQSSEDEGRAARAAFVQWYRSPWRIENYHNSCYMGYVDFLDETKRVPQYAPLPEDYFDELCVLPDGRNYGCHLTREIEQNHERQ